MILRQQATRCRLPSERDLAASPLTPPASMFCFCFQSPSLKLQALEGDPGPSESPLDPPARVQPLPAEDKRPGTTHKLLLHLPPSPPAQDQQTVDPSHTGKTEIMQLQFQFPVRILHGYQSILNRESSLRLNRTEHPTIPCFSQ